MKKLLTTIGLAAFAVGCASTAVNHPTTCRIDYAPLDKYASDYVKRGSVTYEISQWRCVKCGRDYYATNAVSFK